MLWTILKIWCVINLIGTAMVFAIGIYKDITGEDNI